MIPSFDIWKMLAGVAFFLLAMTSLENALRHLAGRSFKLFLKKHTSNKFKAISGGAIVTGLLQSSSIVNLLVLSMVGVGVVKMENALALMLGSNLGTTLDSWLVATVGFNFNIESFALPVIGITGICMAFINKGKKWFLWLQFLFSLAFLFIALGFIKDGMENFVKQTDLSDFSGYPVIIFLLLGILLTTIIQSSLATVAITLSALHCSAITLYIAMAIVLGSEIGTTFKLFLASAKGVADKKRVALGNFIFNIITAGVIFMVLRPVYHLITEVLKIKNDLIALVLFQSLVNIFSVLLFLPVLKPFGRFLLNLFHDKGNENSFISKVAVTESSIALEALEKETKNFIQHVIEYSLGSFELNDSITISFTGNKKFHSKTITEKYNYIKQLHGEMHVFYLKLQNANCDKQEIVRLDQLISVIRNIMYAAKNIRDAQYDIGQIRNSSNDIKYSFYLHSREKMLNFYSQILPMLNKENGTGLFEELTAVHRLITTGYPETLQFLYKENLANRVSQMEISTLINFNRELYTSFKSILFGLKDYLLTSEEAEYFDTLPGFIR